MITEHVHTYYNVAQALAGIFWHMLQLWEEWKQSGTSLEFNVHLNHSKLGFVPTGPGSEFWRIIILCFMEQVEEMVSFGYYSFIQDATDEQDNFPPKQ